jgi:uncharacterized protein YdeI (YjbR/CyaY-like superfamily)
VEIGETLLVETREQWRSWLARNGARKREIWLINYKKGSGGTSLDYSSALKEAICFGWIDGQIKGIDTQRYAARWSPRRPRGNWTAANLERARQLMSEGRMTEAGIASLPPGAVEGMPSR